MSVEIERALTDYTRAAADVDVASMIFSEWGAAHIEQQLECAPAGFVQMAIQLAYFKVCHMRLQVYTVDMAWI